MAPRSVTPGYFRTFGPFHPPVGLPARQIRAYVPAGANELSRRPALFMFDGQNIFGDEGSFSGGWHLDDAVNRMSTRTNHVPVVIGIDHGGDRRIEELSPWSVRGREGLAEHFLYWLADTVVPAMRRELPILGGPEGAVVGGSSMGGLGALYAHYRHPTVFGGALCMSSAFGIGGGKLMEYIASQHRPIVSRVYIDCGKKEGMSRLSERVVQLLAEKGYPQGQLKWRLDPRGTHNERHWARRARPALRFMFRK